MPGWVVGFVSLWQPLPKVPPRKNVYPGDSCPSDGSRDTTLLWAAMKELAGDTALRCPESGRRELHDVAAEA